jgi:hypothetical protein
MPERLPSLMAARKSLAVPARWVEIEEQFNFIVPLDIDGVTQIGLRLRGKCNRNYPDQNLTFQVEYQFRSIAKLVPVARIDWRPLKPHQNRNIGPIESRLMRFHSSHIHLFQENYDWMVGNGLPLADNIKQNLPIALPLDEDSEDVPTLVSVMGRHFNIEGVELIPVPPWTAPRLL